MSRPKKIQPTDGTAPTIKREKRPDPLPFKVYFKHFAANLSLGAVKSADGIRKVYLYDTATHNYSDVTELSEIAAVAKKIFKGKEAVSFILAAFFNPVHAITFMETWLDSIDKASEVELPVSLNAPVEVNS